MRVIKRNGSEETFDRLKIKRAISRANSATSGRPELTERQIDYITLVIEDYCKDAGRALSVEEVQELVETHIILQGAPETAKRYIRYRFTRNLARVANTTDNQILSLIECNNEEVKQENSNKNPTVNSVQRDYMAGEVSKDITNRILLPPDIVEAHQNGIIHFHDADYFAQHMHNCFKGSTKFVTNLGVKSFNSFKDGDIIKVVSADGKWREARVRNYGKQEMQTVVLKSCRSTKKIVCTKNHRWLLKDGSVTTSIRKGMTLAPLRDMHSCSMESVEDYYAWMVGFAIGDGVDKKEGYTTIRLCGDKAKYSDYFRRAGASVTYPKSFCGDVSVSVKGAFKQDFLNAKAWRFFSGRHKRFLFWGLYAADGASKANKIVTSDDRVAELIRDISAVAGYYISSERETVHCTNFKKDACCVEFCFRRHQNSNNSWVVQEVIPYRPGSKFEAWCVEEPETHSFTLDGGVVTGNCDLVNLEDMLQNGTVISGTMIEKPHSFSTACNIATQIIAQVASSQYGGQSISLTHLAPFVQISREKIRKDTLAEMETLGINPGEEKISAIVEKRVLDEIKKGVQTIQYQVVTLMTTNGQAPFITVFMYLGEAKDPQLKHDLALIIEEVLKQRYIGTKNESGVYVTPAFPKLIYVLEEDNITEDSPYWYLTELSAKCTAKRMVPDYISEKMMLKLKIDKNGNGNCYTCMGCRSFLTPYVDENGKPKYYGRFNQGVVTINLVDVACTACKESRNEQRFWEVLDERLELCHRALQCRHERLEGTLSDAAPILWQFGALARLKKGEPITKLLHGGYSTLSLGYAGLWECVYEVTGKKLTEPEGEEFGLLVMKKLNEACAKWKAAENIDYSLYGTPLESTTYKFAKNLQKRFGKINGVTDKNYITNSYHVHVTEEIDAFDKLALEAKFQALSPGGAISYIEVPNMQDNIDAVLNVIKFIYDNIMYAELNTKSDYCQECGYDGEIQIVEEDGKLIWECPNCHNRDESKLNVARRTCGYIGSQFWNQGRTQEIKERVMHL